MKERPILFSAPMVRAILAGNKTQTRWVVKEPISGWLDNADGSHKVMGGKVFNYSFDQHLGDCPYGQPGERLWVRETTIKVEDHGYVGPIYAESEEGREILNWGLAPAPDDCTDVEPEDIKLRPSIFMPRSMCRITLEITAVRVERLHAITEEGATAEGITDGGCLSCGEPEPCGCDNANPSRVDAFAHLWMQIYGQDAWLPNPWVWVIEFKRVTI